jgi:hypothetical protein
MNPMDRRLNRLFKAAAQAPKPAPEEAPFALETRVMADWRASLRAENGDFFVTLFRRAAIGACLLALLSLMWNYRDLTNGEKGIGDELAIADSSMQKGLNP